METRVVILHSNDIHSRLENAARIASIIADERDRLGAERVLALDCGDHMDRMRLETEGSDGLVNIRLLEEAGYEAVTLGNNEGLTFAADMLDSIYKDAAGMAVVCANMRRTDTGERPEWMAPSTVVVKSGLRIGIVGATADFAPFYALLGWQTSEPLAAIREEVRKLRPHVDVMVVLSHLGITLDRRMAEELDGIDLILGAHTHHLLEEPLVINGTTVCAAGRFGEYVGRVEIGMSPDGSRPVIRASVLPTGAYRERREAERIISSFRASGGQRLSRVIATLAEPLPAGADRESPLGNLLAGGLRRWTGAEIGIVNSGQLLGGLAPGDVTAGELHALCPSPINPCRMTIYGAHLRTALEQSLLPEYVDKPIKGFGFRGEVLGMLAVDGMTITYDPSRPPMKRLVSVEVGGEPLSDERLYTAGTIDMFTFRAGYESLANAESCQFYLPEFIRDVVERELHNPASLQHCKVSRWRRITE